MRTPQPVAIVFGSSRGYGKALAEELARRGYAVVCAGRTTSDLKSVSNGIVERGGHSIPVSCDVTQMEDVENAIACALHAYGRIDVAILNAGTSARFDFAQPDLAAFNHVVDVNLRGPINCLSVLVPNMGTSLIGTIAVVSSLLDSRAVPGSAPYIATKSAITCLFEGASLELSRTNIRIVTIRPGFIATAMTAKNKSPMPMLLRSDTAARYTIDRLLKGKRVISFPRPMAIASYLMRSSPRRLWQAFLYTVGMAAR